MLSSREYYYLQREAELDRYEARCRRTPTGEETITYHKKLEVLEAARYAAVRYEVALEAAHEVAIEIRRLILVEAHAATK